MTETLNFHQLPLAEQQECRQWLLDHGLVPEHTPVPPPVFGYDPVHQRMACQPGCPSDPGGPEDRRGEDLRPAGRLPPPAAGAARQAHPRLERARVMGGDRVEKGGHPALTDIADATLPKLHTGPGPADKPAEGNYSGEVQPPPRYRLNRT